MKEVIRQTRARTKSEATVTAVSDVNQRKSLEKLAQQLGTFDDVIPLEELLRLRKSSLPATD